MNEKFFTTEQVANILQVHPFTILKFIKQGKLKGIKLGRVYRIKESDVEDFLEERMTKTVKKVIPKTEKPKQVQKEEKQEMVVPDVQNPAKTREKEATPIYKINKDEREDNDDHYYII